MTYITTVTQCLCLTVTAYVYIIYILCVCVGKLVASHLPENGKRGSRLHRMQHLAKTIHQAAIRWPQVHFCGHVMKQVKQIKENNHHSYINYVPSTSPQIILGLRTDICERSSQHYLDSFIPSFCEVFYFDTVCSSLNRSQPIFLKVH